VLRTIFGVRSARRPRWRRCGLGAVRRQASVEDGLSGCGNRFLGREVPAPQTSRAHARVGPEGGRGAPYNRRVKGRAPRRAKRPRARLGARKSPAACLFEAERLFQDFRELTPYPYEPIARSFKSFAEFERWKRAQKSPWYR
jgi:hypothetical protein